MLNEFVLGDAADAKGFTEAET